MGKWLSNLFSENTDVSMMRVMSFMALMTAIILAFMGRSEYEAFLMASFGAKFAQKFAEAKPIITKPSAKIDNPDA